MFPGLDRRNFFFSFSLTITIRKEFTNMKKGVDAFGAVRRFLMEVGWDWRDHVTGTTAVARTPLAGLPGHDRSDGDDGGDEEEGPSCAGNPLPPVPISILMDVLSNLKSVGGSIAAEENLSHRLDPQLALDVFLALVVSAALNGTQQQSLVPGASPSPVEGLRAGYRRRNGLRHLPFYQVPSVKGGEQSSRYIVIGPTHGHVFSLAEVLEEHLSKALKDFPGPTAGLTFAPLPADLRSTGLFAGIDREAQAGARYSPVHFLFLGDCIDGSHYSMENLALVLLCVAAGVGTLLVGRHEALYPISAAVTGQLGRLENAIFLASSHALGPNATLEEVQSQADVVHRLLFLCFQTLPLAAVVGAKYFCLCGGLTPQLDLIERFSAVSNEQVVQSVLSDPMDDDSDYQPHDLFFTTNQERPDGFVYSFEACCHFLRDADLLLLIRANSFTMNRDSIGTNACGRPWHYQYSPYDPGYRNYRRNPLTALPSTVSLFSAPKFCGLNQNQGAYVVLRASGAGAAEDKGSVEIRQFTARALLTQPPGAIPTAFSWCQPMLESFLRSALNDIAFADVPDKEPTPLAGPAVSSGSSSATSTSTGHAIVDEREAKILRYRRLCQLMKAKGELKQLPGATEKTVVSNR
jgi:hypothetical protein